MTAYELYQQARLDAAIDAATQRVKSAPSAVDARLLLCDLLCFDYQFERAEGQLDVLVEQDAKLTPGTALYRHLIRAETVRRDVFQSGRSPEFLSDTPERLKLHLAALAALRQGEGRQASDLLRQADAARSGVRGRCDGVSFDDFRDLDDVTSAFLEVLTVNGKYYWVEWERIERLEFRPPQYLRDLLWRPAQMVIRGGPEALVFIPVLYVGTHRSGDREARVGRKTEWIGTGDGIMRGVGQRMLLVGDEDKAILSLGEIAFSTYAAADAAIA